MIAYDDDDGDDDDDDDDGDDDDGAHVSIHTFSICRLFIYKAPVQLTQSKRVILTFEQCPFFSHLIKVLGYYFQL